MFIIYVTYQLHTISVRLLDSTSNISIFSQTPSTCWKCTLNKCVQYYWTLLAKSDLFVELPSHHLTVKVLSAIFRNHSADNDSYREREKEREKNVSWNSSPVKRTLHSHDILLHLKNVQYSKLLLFFYTHNSFKKCGLDAFNVDQKQCVISTYIKIFTNESTWIN